MVTPSQEPGTGTDAVKDSPGRGTKEKSVVSIVVKTITLTEDPLL